MRNSTNRLPVIAILLIVVSLSGCAAFHRLQPVISAVGSNAGYLAYRAVPDARPMLKSMCAMSNINDPAALQAAMKQTLGRVWTKASMINTQDAQMALLAINTVVAAAGLQDESQAGMDALRSTLDAICNGVRLAKGSNR